jgi:hypothetical protein
MGECCGCPVSPQKLLTLSVQSNLTNNFVLGPSDSSVPQPGVIEIMSTAPNNPSCLGANGNGNGNGNGNLFSNSKPNPTCNGGCDPTSPEYVFTPELNASIVHSQVLSTGPEVPFAAAGQDDDYNGVYDVTAGYLQTACFELLINGKGAGSCNCGSDYSSSDRRAVAGRNQNSTGPRSNSERSAP